MAASVEPVVRVRRRGRLGHLTLNRPQKLNALTSEMVALVARALDEWEHDDRVTSVLIDGSGDRGLCAGGDIRADGTDPAEFLRAEFRLNDRISRYAKPYVAWMDGVTMGGGVGISAHGAIRVVTERSRVAMPETRIALSPDVGGTFLLSRAPGRVGLHLGLTSGTMRAADAVAAGFADRVAPAGAHDQLVAALEAGDEPQAAVDRLSVTPDPSPLLDARSWIDECYSADSVPEVVERLRRAGGPAATAAETIAGFSPTATAVAFAAIRRASTLTLRECLSMEFEIMLHLAARVDVTEGVRSTLLERDATPHWSPSTWDEVDAAAVEELVAATPIPPLW